MEKEMNVEKIVLFSEVVKNQGKEYTNYFVMGEFDFGGKKEKRKVYVDVPRGDYGMYQVLSMIFGDKKEKELVRKTIVNRDMATNRKTIRYRFEVTSDDGKLVGVVVPKGESNMALLNYLFNQLSVDEDIVTEDE